MKQTCDTSPPQGVAGWQAALHSVGQAGWQAGRLAGIRATFNVFVLFVCLCVVLFRCFSTQRARADNRNEQVPPGWARTLGGWRGVTNQAGGTASNPLADVNYFIRATPNVHGNISRRENRPSAHRTSASANIWLRTNVVNTNGAAAKVMFLSDWGKRYTLAILRRQK